MHCKPHYQRITNKIAQIKNIFVLKYEVACFPLPQALLPW